MDASAVSSAESWLSVIATAKLIGAFLVAAGVVIEFGGDWIAAPYERTVKEARELELARLTAEAETAKASIADAQARQKSAELDLRRLKELAGPREINGAKFLATLEGKAGAAVVIEYAPDAKDGFSTGRQLFELLNKAPGWSALWPKVMDEKFRGFAENTEITSSPESTKIISYGSRMLVLCPPEPPGSDPFKKPNWTLSFAIQAGLGFGANGFSDASIPEGGLTVLIFPR